MAFTSVRFTYLVAVMNMLMTATLSIDVEDFFPEIDGNLTKLTWAHAVNDLAYLNNTLYGGNIMMMEADVRLGTLNGGYEIIPIMAHDGNTSDLSLDMFIKKVNEFNKNSSLANISSNTSNKTRKGKGVKLDFKTIEAFNASLNVIKQNYDNSYPLWINADILPGPINSTVTPVDAAKFLEGCKNFNNSTLSIGWTTAYNSTTTGNYTDNQISDMLDVIRKNNISNRLTFPVRAGLAAESLQQMKRLLEKTSNSTFTIWSSVGDNVNVSNLRNFIANIGVQKIFIDVPDDLKNQLRLDDLPIPTGVMGAFARSAVGVTFSMVLLICSVFILIA